MSETINYGDMTITYPTRCKIVDVTSKEIKAHVGKEGLAEKKENSVHITLDDGSILWGYECWWIPLTYIDR